MRVASRAVSARSLPRTVVHRQDIQYYNIHEQGGSEEEEGMEEESEGTPAAAKDSKADEHNDGPSEPSEVPGAVLGLQMI